MLQIIYQLNGINTPNNTKEANNYEVILSILAIFETKSADNQGENPRITNFVQKMKTMDRQKREYQDHG